MPVTTITGAAYESVHDGQIPAKAVAIEIGKPLKTLQRELNEDDPGAKLGVEDFAQIIKATGDLEPLRFLARLVGVAVIDLRRIREACAGKKPEELAKLALDAMRELGETAEVLRRALEDGKVTKAEFQALERETWETVEVLMHLLESARCQMEGGGARTGKGGRQ